MDDDLREMMGDMPDHYTVRFSRLVELLDVFCDAHLNAEYKTLCREMAVAICQDGSPVLRGHPKGWAAGIVYAIGRVNFLTDPSQKPHMTAAAMATGFGVSQATMMNKAKVIREGLDLTPLHPDWCLPSRMEDNPLVWMLEVNGFLMDIRMAPREAQVVAYDPVALENAKEKYKDLVAWASDAYGALDQIDALLVVTEWNEFRSPDFEKMKSKMKQKIIFDGRNIFEPTQMRNQGFTYYCVGREKVQA